jgi:hypothetical protein
MVKNVHEDDHYNRMRKGYISLKLVFDIGV